MANFSADGQSNVKRVNRASIIAVGTFSSGTIQVQIQIDENWVNIPEAAYTEDFAQVFDFGDGALIRLDLSGSGTPDIDYIINWIR